MARQYVIGVDIGGTKIAAGLVELPKGRILARNLEPTQPERGGDVVLVDVISQARSLQEEAAKLNIKTTGIGIGVAELVSPTGEVLSEATIRWKGMPIADAVRAATGLPARVESDVRAAALAEAKLGAGRGLSSFAFVGVGTGISSCLVMQGVPYAGARGLTGTFASSGGLIPSNEGRLATGPPLEQFASGSALAARFSALRGDRRYQAPDVMAFAESGDKDTRLIVRTAGEALGAAVAHLVNVLDPEAIVLGGGLGLVQGLYRDSFMETLRRYIWSDLHRDIAVRDAQLGVDAGLIGAALAAQSPSLEGRPAASSAERG